MFTRRIKLMDKKPLTFSILIILFLFFSIFCSSPIQAQQAVTLTVGDGLGYRGSHNNSVEVTLDNPDNEIRAVQMDICDVDDYLTCNSCEGINRASGFYCKTSEKGEDGCVRVILISLDGQSIEAGSGPVFSLKYDVSENATGGECRGLNPQNVSVADVSGNPLNVVPETGDFCFNDCLTVDDCDVDQWCYVNKACVDGACQSDEKCPDDDGVWCNGPEHCDEEADTCESPDPCAFCKPWGCICYEHKQECSPASPECSTNSGCDDGLFCSGIETCIMGRCNPGNERCQDDGQFCNGEESCDEENDSCVSSGDPCPPGTTCNEDIDTCEATPVTSTTTTSVTICQTDDDCDDGLFCNGVASCDEENGVCVGGDNPCDEGEECDEENDRCLPPGVPCVISIKPETAEVVSGETLNFTVTPEGECSDPNYEWFVDSTCGSSCDQSGNYKAGIHFDMFNPATDVVMVVDHGNGDISAEATVTVHWGCPLMQIYGENSKEISILRNYRDNLLRQTPEGQELIRLYYQWSPVLVGFMASDEELKKEVKGLIDEILPMVREDMGYVPTVNVKISGENLTPEEVNSADALGNPIEANASYWLECGDIEPLSEQTCGNGEVDIQDVIEAIDIVLGIGDHSDCQLMMADVPNGTPPTCHARDGAVNIFDILVILDVALNRETNCCDNTTDYLTCMKEACKLREVYGYDAQEAASIMKEDIGCNPTEIYGVMRLIYEKSNIQTEDIFNDIGFDQEEYMWITASEYINKHAPLLKFDGSASTFPMDAQKWFEEMLCGEQGGPPDDFIDRCMTKPDGWGNSNINNLWDGNSEISTLEKYGYKVPTYYKVRRCYPETQLRIEYWWFYGWQPKCDCCSGDHRADWEHIMVTVSSVDREDIAAITFYQHSGHYTRIHGAGSPNWEIQEGHPVVYVGKNSHGSYHNNECVGFCGTCAYFDDWRNPHSNTIWHTWETPLINLDGNEQDWLHYDRNASWYWGIDSVGTHPTVKTSNLCHVRACKGKGGDFATVGCWFGYSDCCSDDCWCGDSRCAHDCSSCVAWEEYQKDYLIPIHDGGACVPGSSGWLFPH